jgi:hypothetical protein
LVALCLWTRPDKAGWNINPFGVMMRHPEQSPSNR